MKNKDAAKPKMSKEVLEQKFDKIAGLLRDIKSEWKDRLEAMQEIQGFINSDYSDQDYFPAAFERLAPFLSLQFTDLRTGIVKQAAQIITDGCEVLGERISGFGERIMSTEGLLKQINSGNKVVAELVHECRRW